VKHCPYTTAMWFAEHYDGLRTSANLCPHTTAMWFAACYDGARAHVHRDAPASLNLKARRSN
jgi:hypothetical protein